MAGFEVATHGRFWVAAEDESVIASLSSYTVHIPDDVNGRSDLM